MAALPKGRGEQCRGGQRDPRAGFIPMEKFPRNKTVGRRRRRRRRSRRGTGILGSTGVPHLDTRDLFLLNASRACFRRCRREISFSAGPLRARKNEKGAGRASGDEALAGIPRPLLGEPSDREAPLEAQASIVRRSIREPLPLSSDDLPAALCWLLVARSSAQRGLF